MGCWTSVGWFRFGVSGYENEWRDPRRRCRACSTTAFPSVAARARNRKQQKPFQIRERRQNRVTTRPASIRFTKTKPKDGRIMYKVKQQIKKFSATPGEGPSEPGGSSPGTPSPSLASQRPPGEWNHPRWRQGPEPEPGGSPRERQAPAWRVSGRRADSPPSPLAASPQFPNFPISQLTRLAWIFPTGSA